MTAASGKDRSFDEDRALLKEVPGLAADAQRQAIELLVLNPSPAIREPAVRMGASLLSDDCLVSYLRNPSDDVLRNAGLEMLKLRGREAVAVSVRLLRDRDADVVIQAVQLLDHVKDPRALGPLRGVLKHPNANVVQWAITAIGNIGHDGAAEDLLPFLQGDPWVQFAAVQALGNLRIQASVEPLAQLLTDPMAGSLAAESLARIGGPKAFKHVAKHWLDAGASDDGQLELLAHLLEGLTRKPPRVGGLRAALAKRMADASGPNRVDAARCLLAFGKGREDAAAVELLAHSSTATPLLPTCLSARPDLNGALLAERGVRRNWGFRLVAKAPESAAIDVIASVLPESVQHEYLEAVAEALGAIENADIGAALLEFYLRLPYGTRAGFGPILRRHRVTLRRALDSRSDLQAEMALTLAIILGEEPGEVAAAILELPPNARVDAIVQLGDRADVMKRLPWAEWLAEDPELYGAIAGQVADPAGLRELLPTIRELLLEKPHADLIRMLGNLEDLDSVPVLVSLLDKGEPALHPFLLATLGKLGGTEARRALREVAAGGADEWSRLAYKALADCMTEEDWPLFLDASAHEDWYIRLACAEVLGKAGGPEYTAALMQLAADPVAAVGQRARAFLEQ